MTSWDAGSLSLPTPETRVVDAAAIYRSLGFSPIPVHGPKAGGKSAGKRPKVRDWETRVFDASDFAEGDNIGLRMGGTARQMALDIDGQVGVDSLAALEAEHGDLPSTLTAQSGRADGGFHMLFTVPAAFDISKIRNSARKIGPGLDVRGEGGQIVVCPSRHSSGGSYTWIVVVAPAEMPRWLYDLVAGRKASTPTTMNTVAKVRRTTKVEKQLHDLTRSVAEATEGRRNNALNLAAFAAGQLIGAGLIDRAEAERALAIAGRQAGLDDAEVTATLRSGLDAGEANPQEFEPEKKSKSTRLIDAVIGSGVELFHSADGRAFATLPNGHTLDVRVREFRSLLTKLYYTENCSAPGTEAIADAVGHCEAVALYDGPERAVCVRVAGSADTVFLDLGDHSREVVKVTANGWEVVSSPSDARFIRPSGMLPLPHPARGGSLDPLWLLMNLGTGPRAEKSKAMVSSWLLGALHPSGPYPMLVVQGEQGSGKSGVGRMARSVIDPRVAGLRAPPRDERDLAIAASNSWIIGYDNLSRVYEWMSDALCRVATGGGFATRTLYSERDESLFDFKRPMIATAIDLVLRPDLLDRALMVMLPRIPDENRRTERELDLAFNDALPGILGALLDACSSALANRGSVKLEKLPRMADFAIWVTAGEQALGFAHGRVAAALVENADEVVTAGLEGSPIYAALRAMVVSTWTGTAAKLFADLDAHNQWQRQPAGWPKNAQALGAELKRIAPTLRAAGWVVEYHSRKSDSRSFTLVPPASGNNSSGVPPSAKGADDSPNDYDDVTTDDDLLQSARGDTDGRLP